MIQITIFWGDVTDTFATTETLVGLAAVLLF